MAICHSFLASVEARYFCFQDFFEPEKRHHLTKQKYVSQISNWKNQDSCRFKSIIYPISSDYISCLFNLVRDESESESHSAVSDSVICDPMDYADPTGQNIGVGSHSLLQGIFPTQGLNPGLLHCRQVLYQLSHKESPRILEWVAHPFSSGSSWPRNWTGVSCIAGGFFTNWAIREACHQKFYLDKKLSLIPRLDCNTVRDFHKTICLSCTELDTDLPAYLLN